MCSFRSAALAAALASMGFVALAQSPAGGTFPGIGRAATPAEVAAWDIDVRPDFKGLPPGSGSVARGQQVWESKCASCHGVFGESNEVFNPLVGGTTAADIKTGRVASLQRGDYPGRTTLMKLASISTLWDYTRRAMPWNAPKSLAVDEVYAVTAYMLNLGGIVPDDFTLSDRNIAQAQQRLPNRSGMTTRHGLWPGPELGGSAGPDVRASPCMSNCAPEAQPKSMLPAHARGSHGNLADQNRLVGPQRGAATLVAAAEMPKRAASGPESASASLALLQKHGCVACHAADAKLIGPSWADIRKKHHGQTAYLAGKIRSGSTGVWGNIPMPAQAVNEQDAGRMAAWLAQGLSR